MARPPKPSIGGFTSVTSVARRMADDPVVRANMDRAFAEHRAELRAAALAEISMDPSWSGDWPWDTVEVTLPAKLWAHLGATALPGAWRVDEPARNRRAILGRPDFRDLRKAIDAARRRNSNTELLPAIEVALEMANAVAGRLAEARADDRAGDPAAGSELERKMKGA
ncbi:MAG: hypothetical protein KA105_02550 [Caulobacter sp.]|nr:hypothetical protein [Caulobacter sp.]